MTNTALVKCGITPLCITFKARAGSFLVSSFLSSPVSRVADPVPSPLNVGKSVNQALVKIARCEERECRDWWTVNLCSLFLGPDDVELGVGVGSSKNFRQSSSSSSPSSLVSISSSDSSSFKLS